MYKTLLLSCFVVGLIAPGFSHAQSLEFRIVPQDHDRDSKRSELKSEVRDLRDRVRRLEHAVQELQFRVFNLQHGGMPHPAPTNDKKWFCEIRAFMKEYKAYGPTELEARQSAKSQCTSDNHEMHCKDIKCQENR